MKEVIAQESYLKNAHSHIEIETAQSENTFSPELFTGGSLLELCNTVWERSPGSRWDVQPFLRGCKWSPDGTCCLSVVNFDGFNVTELPLDLYEGYPTRNRLITLMVPAIHVKEPGTVYDFCWYPKMNSHLPETCNWITTKSNSPIQMWDAYNGSLRCSYRAYNSVDEMEPAISVIFSTHGETIMAGYRNCIRTFNVDRPGRDFFEYKINSPASCLATNGKLLAVGSWNRSIKLLSISEMGSGYKGVGNMYGHTGGITHVQFTPDNTRLVSGGRKDHRLLVWDLRHIKTPLNILKRCVTTNQTIYFDISSCGRYLVSGGTDGVVRVWDEARAHWTGRVDVADNSEENATLRFRLHQDSCSSVSIHPSRPILATGSGQFHFVDPVKVLDEEGSSTDEENIDPPPTIPHSDSDQSSGKSQVNSEKCSFIKHDIIDSTLDDKDKINLVGNKQQATKANTQSLKDKVPSEIHKLESSDILSSESQQIDSCREAEDQLYEQVASVNPPVKLEIKDSLQNAPAEAPVDDNAEEPPCKRFALDTGGGPPIPNSFNINSVFKSNTVDEYVKESSLETIVDEELPLKEVNLNVSDGSATQNHKMSITDNAHEEVGQKSSNSVCSNLKDDTTEEYSSVQDMNSDVEAHDVDNNSSTDTLSINLTVNISPPPEQNMSSNLKISKQITTEKVEADKCSFKISNLVPTKQRADVGLGNKKTDLSENSNDNDMKYSSYAENYLAFWWITQVAEVV